MNNVLNTQMLATMGDGIAILGVGRYALAVRFRVRGSAVECRVPTWSGVGDLLEEPTEVTLVAVGEAGPFMRWLFLRGPAALVPDPDWEGLQPPVSGRVSPDDLYQVVRIEPRRMELIDEERGWGFRETVDL
ncbi:MAG TPA: hypothetical protein VNT75_25175 [Symbiobacteriaceae bacterium]|nr:hypothetical protein [Symbiobacteriaceae bacterium]